MWKSEIAVTKRCAIHKYVVKLSVKAIVLDKLTATLAAEKVFEEHLSQLKNVELAILNKVDIILWSDYLFSVFFLGR